MVKILGVLELIFHLLVLPLLPVLFVGVAILWIFRQLVGLWLQIKLGDQFGGLLSAADKIYTPSDEKARKIILSLNYVRSDVKIDFADRVKCLFKKLVYDRPDDYPKLTSTFHSFLGQDYILKNQIDLKDIVKTIPVPKNGVFDEEYLKQFVGSISNVALPKNDSASWDLYLATEPLVNMGPDMKGYIYPYLVRVHHSVADGARLIGFLVDISDNKAEANYTIRLPAKNKKGKTILNDLLNLTKATLFTLYLVGTGITGFLKFAYLKNYQKTPIHGPALSGEKLIAWAIEGDSEHVNMVKNIKNRIPNTKFTDVVFACISASFFSFYKKNNWPVPEKMSSLIPILFVGHATDVSKPVELKNDFTFAGLDMPLIDPMNFLKGLEDIKTSVEEMRGDYSKDISYIMTNYLCAVAPGKLAQVLTNTKPYAMIVSSLPGPKRVKFVGCDLIANISTAPHSSHTGITFTIVTYDNRFHMCLLVDKALISEQKVAQYIVDQTLKNMEILNRESLKMYKQKKL